MKGGLKAVAYKIFPCPGLVRNMPDKASNARTVRDIASGMVSRW